MTDTATTDADGTCGVGTVDRDHLLLVGSGPGLGMAVAQAAAPAMKAAGLGTMIVTGGGFADHSVLCMMWRPTKPWVGW